MLNRKARTNALKGFQMVTTLLLAESVKNTKQTPQSIEALLLKSRENATGKLRVDCVILPVIITHLFVRSLREGNWM